MTDTLDKALHNLQAQIDKEAENKRLEEEAKHKQAQERREKENKAKRLSCAIKENQIDEVNDLIKEDFEKEHAYRECINSIPSVEMAEIIIDDISRVFAENQYYYNDITNIITSAIRAHPEDAAKWDEFAKKHKISYDFKTSDREIYGKVLAQGFDPQCFNFESLAQSYYSAKNGHIAWRETGGDNSESFWSDPKPEKAAQIKEDLIYALSMGYQIDLSKEDSKSYLFMQELIKERELQKQGVDKSFVYRDPSEEFYDPTTKQCKLTLSALRLLCGYTFETKGNLAEGTIEDGKFTGCIYEQDNSYRKFGLSSTRLKETYKNGLLDGDYIDRDRGLFAQYKEGKLHGVYRTTKGDFAFAQEVTERYYENGVDVTEKREALKRIADHKIKKEEELEAKKLPEVIEKLGKAQIKLNSKIKAAIAAKRAEKDGRK